MDQTMQWSLWEHDLELTRDYQKKRVYYACKRGIDLAVSALCLLGGSPLLLLIAALVKVDSPGPVLFRQERVGLRKRCVNGQVSWTLCTFTMFKFRTMRHDCGVNAHREHMQKLISGGDCQPEANGAANHKLHNDPRVTRVGKLLRRTCADELPQLLNVLRGEMSLVGPRPAIPYEVAEYQAHHRKRLGTVPGCIGLWQVSGWNVLNFEEMVELDVRYIKQQSLWLDAMILAKMASAVLSGKGGG